MADSGLLIVISGFSGSGKGTIMKELIRRYPEKYALSISATTRQPREGEQDGRDGHTVSFISTSPRNWSLSMMTSGVNGLITYS